MYRTVNTKARGVSHNTGGDFAWERNTKRQLANASSLGKMHAGKRRGLDYTPLFMFLLSKVGQPWPSVCREAASRLDKDDPIFWMVAKENLSPKSVVRVGDNSYYSGLFVDDEGRLALVDPNISEHHLSPTCACCSHTFNGKRFSRPYVPGADYPGK